MLRLVDFIGICWTIKCSIKRKNVQTLLCTKGQNPLTISISLETCSHSYLICSLHLAIWNPTSSLLSTLMKFRLLTCSNLYKFVHLQWKKLSLIISSIFLEMSLGNKRLFIINFFDAIFIFNKIWATWQNRRCFLCSLLTVG